MVLHSSLQVVNSCRQPCKPPEPNYDYLFQEQCHYECFQAHNVDVWKYSISTGLLVATIQLIVRFIWNIVFNGDRPREYRCVNCRPNNELCRKFCMWVFWFATIGFMIGLVYFSMFDVCSSHSCFEEISGSGRASTLVVMFGTLFGSAEVLWFVSWISMA